MRPLVWLVCALGLAPHEDVAMTVEAGGAADELDARPRVGTSRKDRPAPGGAGFGEQLVDAPVRPSGPVASDLPLDPDAGELAPASRKATPPSIGPRIIFDSEPQVDEVAVDVDGAFHEPEVTLESDANLLNTSSSMALLETGVQIAPHAVAGHAESWARTTEADAAMGLRRKFGAEERAFYESIPSDVLAALGDFLTIWPKFPVGDKKLSEAGPGDEGSTPASVHTDKDEFLLIDKAVLASSSGKTSELNVVDLKMGAVTHVPTVTEEVPTCGRTEKRTFPGFISPQRVWPCVLEEHCSEAVSRSSTNTMEQKCISGESATGDCDDAAGYVWCKTKITGWKEPWSPLAQYRADMFKKVVQKNLQAALVDAFPTKYQADPFQLKQTFLDLLPGKKSVKVCAGAGDCAKKTPKKVKVGAEFVAKCKKPCTVADSVKAMTKPEYMYVRERTSTSASLGFRPDAVMYSVDGAFKKFTPGQRENSNQTDDSIQGDVKTSLQTFALNKAVKTAITEKLKALQTELTKAGGAAHKWFMKNLFVGTSIMIWFDSRAGSPAETVQVGWIDFANSGLTSKFDNPAHYAHPGGADYLTNARKSIVKGQEQGQGRILKKDEKFLDGLQAMINIFGPDD